MEATLAFNFDYESDLSGSCNLDQTNQPPPPAIISESDHLTPEWQAQSQLAPFKYLTVTLNGTGVNQVSHRGDSLKTPATLQSIEMNII